MLLKIHQPTSAEIASPGEAPYSYSETGKQVMRLPRGLVPCDTVNLGAIDLGTEEGFHFALGGFLMPPERRVPLPRFMHRNPMVEFARKHGHNPPLRFTDFYTRRQFGEVPICRECYRGHTFSMITFGIAAPRLMASRDGGSEPSTRRGIVCTVTRLRHMSAERWRNPSERGSPAGWNRVVFSLVCVNRAPHCKAPERVVYSTRRSKKETARGWPPIVSDSSARQKRFTPHRKIQSS